MPGVLFFPEKYPFKPLSEKTKKEEKQSVSKKEIVKKILTYSIPFIIISLIYNLYNTVDMILISRTMNDILGYSADTIESVISVFTTWGVKLNNIILAVIILSGDLWFSGIEKNTCNGTDLLKCEESKLQKYSRKLGYKWWKLSERWKYQYFSNRDIKNN